MFEKLVHFFAVMMIAALVAWIAVVLRNEYRVRTEGWPHGFGFEKSSSVSRPDRFGSNCAMITCDASSCRTTDCQTF